MGAPESGLEAAGQSVAEGLLTSLRTIKDSDRARHAAVLDYWLSIRGDKEFPPLHDLDPLEISDAGPSSILLELISGGQDAEIRHLGDDVAEHVTVQKLIDAPNPSLLSSIARKLPIVGISRDFLAFEDSFSTADSLTRCWVTLLPLSSCGSWVDYVYAFVTVERSGAKPAKVDEAPAIEPDLAPEPGPTDDDIVEAEAKEPLAAEAAPAEEQEPDETPALPAEEHVTEVAAELVEPVEQLTPAEPVAEPVQDEPIAAVEVLAAPDMGPEAVAEEDGAPRSSPGFSRLIEGIANLAGFYGQGITPEPDIRIDVPALGGAPQPQDDQAEELPVDSAEPAEAPVEASEPAQDEQAAPAGDGDPQTEDVSEPLAEAAPAPGDTVPRPELAVEGTLQNKLADVRARADEARQAQLRATRALHEGLSAAYDFALDAEGTPEEYLRLVEAQGLKIQLRAPMAPVAKLAFDGVCDPETISQFEAVLAWALKEELPRGTLLERIDEAGGIPQLLNAA